MVQARKYCYDENLCAHFHVISRIVQGSYLFGVDQITGINYDHRLDWVQNRPKELAGIFTIVVGGHSIMHNHLHLIVQTRPDLTEVLTNREVAQRYFKLCPPKQSKKRKLSSQEWKILEDELIANEIKSCLSHHIL